MRVRLVLVCLAVLVATFASSPLYADSIAIQNASFETYLPLTLGCAGTGCAFNGGPIPGWSLAGAGGSWQPSTTYFNLPPPDGNIVAYTNGGTISQSLTGISLLPDSVYTLSVFVGNRLDGISGPYSIALDAGGTTLTSFTGLATAITPGAFSDEILTFSTGSTVASGDLSIELASQGGQADFDNVSLSVAVPEPTSLILLAAGAAFVGLFSILRRA